MKHIVLCIIAFALPAFAQIEILGLRTYANNDEYLPPIIGMGEQITIEFDVKSSQPPNLHIIFRHASRRWEVDNDLLINDPLKLRAEALQFSAAPPGVVHYTFRYRNSFPNRKNFVEFLYSGHYIYSIVDQNAGGKVLAEGKFIVTESTVPVVFTIENAYHTEYPAPMNQINKMTVNVSLPSEFTAGDPKSINFPDVTTVHIIKNWELDRPEKVEVVDDDPETFVENHTTPSKTFWKKNCFAGNEYRRIDLSSSSLYPNNVLSQMKNSPDVSRFQWQGSPDANGASKLNAFTGTNSDYLQIGMRLRLAQSPAQNVFLVGPFSQWKPLRQYEMIRDTATGLYALNLWLRRGVYDYQYVLGTVDQNGTVIDQDWISLEGNDWRTINRYTALVWYRDPRFGGFDRVIGHARSRNPGTNIAGKRMTVTYPQQK